MRVRQSVERNKIPLIICTLLAIIGVIGWLNSSL
jgi:predicted negative regulator of RcsB-dependent stress response